MDILIKGLEMPKGEEDLKIIINADGSVHRIIGWAISEKKNAKAIELPPHSDLIDRDELLTDLADRICVDDMLDGIYQPAIDRINEAKTVLEAST